ncbi:MAG: hypothetical protein WBL80_02825 [Erysipelotrichaceae bacterium]
MNRIITKEDVEFLKNLQQEMLTQEHDCQAEPRFWTVAQTEKKGGIADGYQDGSVIYDSHCCEEFGSTIEAAKTYLKDNEEYVEDMDEINELEELVDFLNEHDPDNGSRYDLRNYKIVENVLQPNTFFLTKKACKQHIEANKHHYNGSVHSYAMTAWRSAQVERLYEILENVNFNSLMDNFIQFGTINEKETREMDSVVCPHCHHRTSFEDIASKFNSKELNKFNIVYDGGVNSSEGGVTCPECGKKHNVWINTVIYSFVEEE